MSLNNAEMDEATNILNDIAKTEKERVEAFYQYLYDNSADF